jgi:hypothetical protein
VEFIIALKLLPKTLWPWALGTPLSLFQLNGMFSISMLVIYRPYCLSPFSIYLEFVFSFLFFSNFGVQCHLIFQVSAFLLHHFSEVADYSFTANMETEVVNISHFVLYVICHTIILETCLSWLVGGYCYYILIKPAWKFSESAHRNGHWNASNCAHDYFCIQDISNIVIIIVEMIQDVSHELMVLLQCHVRLDVS